MRTFLFSCVCISLLSLTSCKDDSQSELTTKPQQEITTAFEDPPQWSKEVVWYQIFVERFRNGDSSNDPTKADIEGAHPGLVPDSWTVTPWTKDWYSEDPYFKDIHGKMARGGYAIERIDDKIQFRRYGGDLQGVLDKIDYLDSLGVTAVYFNPLNDAPSLHKYDPKYWRHIDRNFGPNPESDVAAMAAETHNDPSTWQFTEADNLFLEVIKTMHDKGMKVILDYSWNHTGTTFWAWQDLVKNQSKSEYKDWYWVKQFDNPETPENEFEYSGWVGLQSLPEIKETSPQVHKGGVHAMEGNVYNEAAKQHIFNVSKRWLDPNNDGDPSDGVDGFRLDVAAEMPLGFWREYRTFVRGINPDAYLLGEIWWEEWPDKLLDPEPFVKGDVFDAPMNYRWFRAARHYFNKSPNSIRPSEFVDSLNSFTSNLRPQSNYAMMNLTASHDVPRVGTSLLNKNKYKYNSSPYGDANYNIGKPDETTYKTLKLLLTQQFTYIGSPHIWAGDEMGMWGVDDPSCRKPLIWPDYQFENETTHPLGLERNIDEVKFNTELFNFYKHIIAIRQQHPVLIHGDINFLLIDDANDVLAYQRFDKDTQVITVFNNSDKRQTINVPVSSAKKYTDVLYGAPVVLNENQKSITVNLEARTSAILAQD